MSKDQQCSRSISSLINMTDGGQIVHTALFTLVDSRGFRDLSETHGGHFHLSPIVDGNITGLWQPRSISSTYRTEINALSSFGR